MESGRILGIRGRRYMHVYWEEGGPTAECRVKWCQVRYRVDFEPCTGVPFFVFFCLLFLFLGIFMSGWHWSSHAACFRWENKTTTIPGIYYRWIDFAISPVHYYSWCVCRPPMCSMIASTLITHKYSTPEGESQRKPKRKKETQRLCAFQQVLLLFSYFPFNNVQTPQNIYQVRT